LALGNAEAGKNGGIKLKRKLVPKKSYIQMYQKIIHTKVPQKSYLQMYQKITQMYIIHTNVPKNHTYKCTKKIIHT
jgi:hypothetical protein